MATDRPSHWHRESVALLTDLEARLVVLRGRRDALAAEYAAVRQQVTQLDVSIRALKKTLDCVAVHDPPIDPPGDVVDQATEVVREHLTVSPPITPAGPPDVTPALDEEPRPRPTGERRRASRDGRPPFAMSREAEAGWARLPLSDRMAPLDPARVIWPLFHTQPTCRDLVTLWLRSHGYRLVVGEASAFFASQGYYRDAAHAQTNLNSLLAQKLHGWTRPEKGVYVFHELEGRPVGAAQPEAMSA